MLKEFYPHAANEEIMYNFSETLLYEIAVEKFYDASIDAYLYQLHSSIKKLESYKRTLLQRISKPIENEFEIAKLHDQMKMLYKKIETTLPSLCLLRNYLSHHKAYFHLFELESLLLYRYTQELNALKNCGQDPNCLRHAIHQSIMLRYSQSFNKYPYISYAQTISKDIKTIEQHIGQASSNYAERIYYAQELYYALNSIKAVVVSSTHYYNELLEKEKADRKERELELQQQQLRELQHQTCLCEKHCSKKNN